MEAAYLNFFWKKAASFLSRTDLVEIAEWEKLK